MNNITVPLAVSQAYNRYNIRGHRHRYRVNENTYKSPITAITTSVDEGDSLVKYDRRDIEFRIEDNEFAAVGFIASVISSSVYYMKVTDEENNHCRMFTTMGDEFIVPDDVVDWFRSSHVSLHTVSSNGVGVTEMNLLFDNGITLTLVCMGDMLISYEYISKSKLGTNGAVKIVVGDSEEHTTLFNIIDEA